MAAIRAKTRRKSKLTVRTILGKEIEKSDNGWSIKDARVAVEKRHYHGDKINYKKLKCYDEKNDRYINVEHFQPVVYDLDNAPPAYNPKWEIYDGTGKNKKLIKIEFPPSYVRYWEKQLIRCVDGYEVGGVYLTGPYYFFLNFWRIKGKKVGSGYIVPRFLDIGKMFFDYVQEAQDNDKNVMFLKRRQIGCSEMCAAIAAWYFTFQPVSENMIIAGEGTYAENTMKKCKSGLSEFSRFSGAKSADPFYKRLIKDTVEETISGWKENGVPQGFQSRLLSVTVKDNVQKASGKSFGKDTPVLMADGTTRMVQDVKQGDLVMGIDGSPRRVLHTHTGQEKLYRIKQKRGLDYVVNESHIMVFHHKPMMNPVGSKRRGTYVQNNFKDKDATEKNGFLTMPMKDWATKSKTYRYHCQGIKSSGLNFDEQEVTIDPYIFGMWLGDGDSDAFRFTTMDEPVMEAVENWANDNECITNYQYKPNNRAVRIAVYREDGDHYNFSPRTILRNLGVFKNKHIPKEYLFNSREIRLATLAGLIDSDGCRDKKAYNYEICLKDTQLVHDTAYLIRSLGFHCSMNDKVVNGTTYKRLYFSGKNLHEIPCKIPRKQYHEPYNGKVNQLLTSLEHEDLGEGDYYGFSVDGDNMFLLQDFTIVHNSPTLVILEEAGRFQHLQTVYNMVLPSVQEGGTQGGRIIIFIGTGGEMDKGVAEMQEFFYKPEVHGLLAVNNEWDKDVSGSKSSVFFPAWLYFVTDKDGNSYKEIGTFLVLEQRELLKTELKALHTYKTQMPLNPAEAFTASGLSPFNVEKLSEQRTKILANNWEDIRQRGKLDWVTNGKGTITGVKWTAADDISKLDHEGDLMYPFTIFEHPKVPDRVANGKGLVDGTRHLNDPAFVNLYQGGTDPYDKDEAVGGGSLGSCSIFKGVNETNLSGDTSMLFVARLTWRPAKAKKFYEATAKLCAYYNAQNLIEYSNVGIFSWYEDNGWAFLLKERPLLAQSVFKNSQVNNKFGIDPQTRPYWINNYAQYVEDYYSNFYDLEQVQRAIAFRRKGLSGKKHNDDITDAAMLAYQHFLDNKMRKFKVVETKKKKKRGALFGTYRTAGGTLVKAA